VPFRVNIAASRAASRVAGRPGLSPLWDDLFGTAYFPRADEWPAVGLSDVAEPKTIADYLLMPFRR
jgi:hypothetical protein